MFAYRKTTKAEDEKWENKCSVTLQNTMRCARRITRVVNNNFLCEHHYQLRLAFARNAAEEILNLDEGGEILSGKSEPMEK